MTIKDIVKAGTVAAKRVFGNTEDEATIEWRLSVCETCPMKKARATKAKEKASLALAGLRQGPVCGVCGCSLALLTCAHEEDLHEDSPTEAAQRPESCWMKS